MLSPGTHCRVGLCGKNLLCGFDTESLIPAMSGSGQETAKDRGINDITQSVVFPTEKFLFYLKPLPVFLIHHASKKWFSPHQEFGTCKDYGSFSVCSVGI